MPRLIGSILMVLTGCAATVAAQPREGARVNGTVKGETGTKIDKRLVELADKDFSGVVLVAHRGDVILAKGYGFADRARKVPYTTDTVFDIGSITKPFIAAAILKLKMDGRLKVTDPITKFFKGVPEDKEEITLHHLLTHTAGFKDSLGDDYDKIGREEFVKLALASKLRSKKSYSYSNVGYSLLGVIIEQVTGVSCEKYLQDHLLKPARMTKTGYVLPKWGKDELARGYRKDKDWGTPLDHAWADDGPYWHLRANGGLLSTVGDLWEEPVSTTSMRTGDFGLGAAARSGPTSMRKPLSRAKARRLRDFPNIHSASSADAERHESLCGCFHSHRRRRVAPCRTSGCNLSPALDLDVEPHFACVTNRFLFIGFAAPAGKPSWLACQGSLLLPESSSLQHRPHHAHQVMSGGYQRDLLSLGIIALRALEVRADGRRTPARLPGSLGKQAADDRRAFAGDVPEPIPVTRLVLTRNQPEIPPDCFSMSKAVRIIHERGHRFRRADTNSWDAPQSMHGERLLSALVQLLFDSSHLPSERFDLFEQKIPPQSL